MTSTKTIEQTSKGIPEETQSFLNAMYGQARQGFLTIWTPDRKTKWFELNQLDLAIEESLKLSEKQNVYYGVGLRKERLTEHQRGASKDVYFLPGLWVEIDVKSGEHAAKNLPNSEEVKDILKSFPLEVSIVNHSGGGYHCYWLLKEPVLITNEEDQQGADRMLKRFQNLFIQLAKEKGLHIDNTSDLARVLRVPGTLNFKSNPPKPVKNLKLNDKCRYTQKELREAIEKVENEMLFPNQSIPDKKKVSTSADDLPDAKAEPIIKECKFIQSYLNNKDSATYGEWIAALSIGAHCEDHESLCHSWSEGHSGYSEKETDQKINEIRSNMKPRTCAAINAEFGSCGGCLHLNKINSPIALGMRKDNYELFIEENEHVVVKKVKPFPTDIFPKDIQTYVEKSSEAVSAPTDFTAIGVLAVVSALIGNQAKIKITSEWLENCILYTAFIGSPGARKTPALKKAMYPLNEIQKEITQLKEQQEQMYEFNLMMYEDELAKWKKIPAKDRDIEDRPIEPKPPAHYQIKVNDITIETVMELMKENNLLMERDEFAGWIKSMNQYKGGSGGERQTYLEFWNGNRVDVNRKGGKHLFVENPFISIVGGIQPDRLAELLSDNVNDGFIERILFSYPEEFPDVKLRDVIIPANVKFAYLNACNSLYYTKKDENKTYEVIELSEAARELFTTYYEQIYKETKSKTFNRTLEGAWIKLSGYLARFTLILHLLHHTCGSSHALNKYVVDEQIVVFAIQLVDYFKSHIEKVYSFIHSDEQDKRCLEAVEWINKKTAGRVTVRELQQAKVCRVKNKQEATDLLTLLAQNGYGQIEEIVAKNHKKVLEFVLFTEKNLAP